MDCHDIPRISLFSIGIDENIPQNSLAEKKDFIKKSTDLEIHKENLSPSQLDKPIDNNIIEFPQESICILKKPSYELFEERVLKILSMTNKEYFSQLGKERSFLMAPTVETASILRKRLKQTLESNTNDNIQ